MDLLRALAQGDRVALSKAITLVESRRPESKLLAQSLIKSLSLKKSGLRLAISGAPGVGKSTFIEALGLFLIDSGLKPAILTIDPSSHVSGGSILGDRTRMEELSKSKKAFIRQSPSANFLGGVARRTRETILLCEEAGFDVVIVETVGVGQSEYVAEQLTDLFVLLIQPGSGDDLQGVKRGVMEMSDLLVVTKADGNLEKAAQFSLRHLANAAHMLRLKDHGQKRSVLSTSALTGLGLEKFWQNVSQLHQTLSDDGFILKKRSDQRKIWLHDIIEENWLDQLYNHPSYTQDLKSLENSVESGDLDVYEAAKKLLDKIWRRN